jgi:hypothetical protein
LAFFCCGFFVEKGTGRVVHRAYCNHGA